jgi:pimeloyl-ACP methyl ester carboxylesterase
MKHCTLTLLVATLAVLVASSAVVRAADAPPQTTTPDLKAVAEGRGATVPAGVSLTWVGDAKGKPALRVVPTKKEFDEKDTWVVPLAGVEFTDGVIEVDVLGQSGPPQSNFLGIAFGVTGAEAYEAVYFRPFNFRARDDGPRSRAVQYVAHPKFPWYDLRKNEPGRYEKPVVPAPDGDGWFRVKVVVAGPQVSAYVNDGKEPSLAVERLSDRKGGSVGLWVGPGQGGHFANLRITPAAVAAPSVRVETGSVVSADGTRIGYSKYGSGPAVVVSHGTHTVADDWGAFGREMGRHHTVYVYDRRGRGSSPDIGKPYTNESEVDDLAAMVKLAGPDAAILGHSFGGGVAIAYALRDGFTGRLITYEAGHSVTGPVDRGHLPDLQKLMDAEEYDRAAEYFLLKIAQMPKGEVAKFKSSPMWPGIVELNKLAPREMGFLRSLTWTPEQLSKLRCRSWLLLGSQTNPPPGEVSRTAALVDRVPAPTLYPLMGQGHVAYVADPQLLARVVTRCLADE